MATRTQTATTYTRFGIFERIEHFILILSFTTLGVTGLPQKYAMSEISQAVINLFGGIESTRVIHRIAAAVFLLQSIYHIVMALYKVFVRRRPASMIPGIKDGKDAIQAFGYNLGFVKEPPKMPRYNFMEKMEYWAMLWGLVLMGLTGLMLWNPIATTQFLPGDFIPAAKAAHGAEALLAVLAIIIWHFYNVHIKHFNKAMFTGSMTRHQMMEEHGEELEAIETGQIAPEPSPASMRKRLMLFLPVAGVFSLVLVGLTWFFLTFEQTAITTVPPVSDVPVYVRATPTAMPTKAPTKAAEEPAGAPSGELTWFGSIFGMMDENCAGCHGSMGGFSVETYADMMQAVSAGDPDGSSVVQVQQAGGHPGQLEEADLNLLIEWIQAGAPEGEQSGAVPEVSEGSGTTNPPADTEDAAPADANSWDGSINAMFQEKCVMCHGDMGGFSAESYAGVMEAVTSGDPDNSKVITVQMGDHPGLFTNEQFDAVRQWIEAGAPER